MMFYKVILKQNLALTEKMLCLDTNTRWNNLQEMLDRFFEIKSAISKALIDIK